MQKYLLKFQNFMRYRYGVDTLGKHLMNLSLVLMVLGFFIKSPIYNAFVLALLLFTNYRMFSKKRYKRSKENRMYLQAIRKVKARFNRLKDFKDYKYFKCPECKLQMRAPRKRGEIVVTCSSCKHKFDQKT